MGGRLGLQGWGGNWCGADTAEAQQQTLPIEPGRRRRRRKGWKGAVAVLYN
jgi:hypothetical protein